MHDSTIFLLVVVYDVNPAFEIDTYLHTSKLEIKFYRSAVKQLSARTMQRATAHGGKDAACSICFLRVLLVSCSTSLSLV